MLNRRFLNDYAASVSEMAVCTVEPGSTLNSLHATGRYIGHMNNSLAKKEIMKRKKKVRKKVTEPGYELKTHCMTIVLATHHATHALAT